MYDYRYEPHRLVFMIDNKSFFASCESLRLGLNPMKSVLAVISHQPDSSWGSGLIMAASPLAKKKYGLHNVMRARNLPSRKEAPDLMLVDPHMNLYIKRSMQVLDIFHKYAADEDIHMYSIDEGMIDMTDSWKLFGDDPYYVARKIQKDIHDTLGLYTTCGIGENPLLAKLAMDISAKHRESMIDFWHYIDVPDTIWRIPKLEDIWGINTRTANHLRRLGINNMYDLAHSNPAIMKREFGVIGEQVAARIRAHDPRTGKIGLFIGYSFDSIDLDHPRGGFKVQKKIIPTNDNHDLTTQLIDLFRSKWQGEGVKNIGVDYGDLSLDISQQFDLFVKPDLQIKRKTLDKTVDNLRKKYGFSSVVKASSLLPGATAIRRSKLVGGHNGGNAYE